MLCLMQKENDITITKFHIKFKGIYDELNELQPLPQCSCGADKELMKEKIKKFTFFLIALTVSNSYESHNFQHEPLSSLRKTVNIVLRKEARCATEKERIYNKPDVGATFYSSGSKHKWRDGFKSKCDHYGKIGHLKSKCFEIVEYLSNWDMCRVQCDKEKQGGYGVTRLEAANGNQNMGDLEEATIGRALYGMNIKNGAVTCEG